MIVITVRIQGGLGNQMFQYAYARRLQCLGLNVKMHWHPSRRKSLHTGYSLDSVFSEPLKKYVPLSNDDFLSTLTQTLKRKFFKVRQGGNVGYDQSLLEIRSGYVDGYFQSEQYFSGFEDQLKKELEFAEIVDDENKALLDWIDSNFVIAVHIRGGDYLNRGPLSGDMGTVCGPKYYKAAIAEMLNRFPNAQFLVFSDDFNYANRLMGQKGFKAVDWNTGEDSWKDMALMARCHAHITANSSFSWWGAWLANSALRIMPGPWFPKFAGSNNPDIYPAGALVLEKSEEQQVGS